MKKLFLLIASACMLAPATSFAQEVKRTEDDKTVTIVEETQTPEGKILTTTVYQKNSVFTNGFWHNWELMAGVGTQFYFGDNDKYFQKFTEMLTFPDFDLYLTKWASPSFGVGIGANYAGFTGLYQSRESAAAEHPHFTTNKDYPDAPAAQEYYKLKYQDGKYLNMFALLHADLSTVFFGYNPDRFFNVDAYAGGGFITGFGEKAVGATFNAGLANKFRLSNQLSLLLNIRGAIASDDFDGEGYTNEPTEEHIKHNVPLDGLFGATVGLSWKIGKEHSKWIPASRVSTIYYNDAVLADKARLEKALADAANANADLKKQLADNEKVQYIKEVPDMWFHINFIVDRWDLVKRELINLQSVAGIMKSTPNTKYLLVGYADKQTATPSHNLMLSKNRVESVYNTLVNEYGVDPEQLTTDYKGGVDYMFYNEKELSRCVMISAIKE